MKRSTYDEIKDQMSDLNDRIFVKYLLDLNRFTESHSENYVIQHWINCIGVKLPVDSSSRFCVILLKKNYTHTNIKGLQVNVFASFQQSWLECISILLLFAIKLLALEWPANQKESKRCASFHHTLFVFEI